MKRKLLARWRANFLAGLLLTLPALISLGVLAWLFKTVSGFTDGLLFFLPTSVTHGDHGHGAIHWYWSAVALFLAIFLICLVGLIGRYYFGKQILVWIEDLFMRVPVLNKIYGATKQFNDAFAAGNKNSFKTVALIEFPHAGMYSLGFITGEPRDEVQAKSNEKVVSVFVPTTPNPTAGFLVIVPENKVVKLEMSVGEALKYVVSLGSIEPEYEAKIVKKRESVPRKERLAPNVLKMIQSATGIILRTRPLTDTSLIVNWLTADFGRVSTAAKGARRDKSPFRGKLDLFYEADFGFSRSLRSDLHALREVRLLEIHAALRTDIHYLQQAAYAAALIEQSTEKETPLPAIYELMHQFLGALPLRPPQPRNVYAFELKLLAELGLNPDLAQTDLRNGTKGIINALLEQDWDEISRLKCSAAQAAELRQFLHGFLIFHLGKIPKQRTAAIQA